MKEIVLSAYEGYPNPDIGGPNKIIYQLIQGIDYNIFGLTYISSDYQARYSAKETTYGAYTKLSFKKRFLLSAYQKSKIARAFFSSSLYLLYRFNKRDRFLRKYLIDGEFLIAHDVRSFALLHRNFKYKTLVIHSKGSIEHDFMEYFGNKKLLKGILKKFKEYQKIAITYADLIVFPSWAARNIFIVEVGDEAIENKSIVIHNGINLGYINQIAKNNNPAFIPPNNYRLFLTVGDHIPVKRIEIIIKSIEILKKQRNNAILIVIGDGPLTKHLKNLSATLKVSDHILFLPKMSNNLIISIMKSCDLFIMASEKVIFDMVILEALAAGCRIIANKCGGNLEIIKDGINGYLIEINTAQNLADKILELDYDRQITDEETLKYIDVSRMVRAYETIIHNFNSNDSGTRI